MVQTWLEAVRQSSPTRSLWIHLDDPLRLALAQGWILRRAELDTDVARRDRVDLAHALTPVDASHPLYMEMLADLHDFWRNAYRGVLDESGVVNQTNLVAPDMEIVILTPPEYIGRIDGEQPVPVHCFVTRYAESDGWVIAALSRRLPVPGWPPTERQLPGWEAVTL